MVEGVATETAVAEGRTSVSQALASFVTGSSSSGKSAIGSAGPVSFDDGAGAVTLDELEVLLFSALSFFLFSTAALIFASSRGLSQDGT
jgi:hypothetical protein